MPETNPATLKAKKDAAQDFTRALLASEAGKQLIKVILFGSVATGTANEESDIDLLVIATGNLEKVRDASADASFQTWLRCHQGIEPLIYCVDILRFGHSDFLKQAMRMGEEVFSVGKEDRIREEAGDYLSLAEEYLEGATRSLSVGDLRLAIDAAYNSAELCTKGLICLKGAEIPGSHGGVVNRFGELYIQSGDASKDLGRSLNRYLELRNRARYDLHAEITPEGARKVLELAEKIIDFLKNRMQS
jgi:uncharacterized protein (UPF0332 family)/predicted nucleotidyltransferase